MYPYLYRLSIDIYGNIYYNKTIARGNTGEGGREYRKGKQDYHRRAARPPDKMEGASTMSTNELEIKVRELR